LLAVGADVVASADFSFGENGDVVEMRSFSRKLLYLAKLPWLRVKRAVLSGYLLIKEDIRNLIKITPAVPLGILNILVVLLGGLISLFNRDYIFKKITAHELGHFA